jgi:undecaprenyl-diphosphatase
MAIIRKGLGLRTQDSDSEHATQDLRPETRDLNAYPSNLLWQIIIASIPAAILGYLIEDYVESKLHSPLLLAFNLAVFGVILFLVDKYAKTKLEIKNAKYKQSFIVGIAQSLALIPGVSRSGITMLAGRALGLNRESAARFSFLLGTPAMIGAFLFAAKDLTASDLSFAFICGVVSSTIFGFLAIKYLLEYLKKGSFAVFMWYRIALAVIVMAVYFAR